MHLSQHRTSDPVSQVTTLTANCLKRTIELFDVLFLLLLDFITIVCLNTGYYFFKSFLLLEHLQAIVPYIWLLYIRKQDHQQTCIVIYNHVLLVCTGITSSQDFQKASAIIYSKVNIISCKHNTFIS